MRRVPSLDNEPAALAEWRGTNLGDDQATGLEAKHAWNRFKDSGEAYGVLLRALLTRQQGLCGYCEQRVSKRDGTLVVNDYQVEHVLAKSGGPSRVLDWHNLMLCCGGGTWRHHRDTTRYLKGSVDSCGQAKGDSELGAGCDPRTFGWRESVVTIDLDGRMRANVSVCERLGIDPEQLTHSIEHVLRLNCERLRLAREKVATEISRWVVQLWTEAVAHAPHLSKDEIAGVLEMLAGGRLRPDEHGHLIEFWTTQRQYLGSFGEAWISANAGSLNYE